MATRSLLHNTHLPLAELRNTHPQTNLHTYGGAGTLGCTKASAPTVDSHTSLCVHSHPAIKERKEMNLLFVYRRVNSQQWKKMQRSFHSASLKIDAVVQACHTSLTVVPSSVGFSQVGKISLSARRMQQYMYRQNYLVHVYKSAHMLMLCIVMCA